MNSTPRYLLLFFLFIYLPACTTRLTGMRYEGVDTSDRLPSLTEILPSTRPVPSVLVRLSSGQDWRGLRSARPTLAISLDAGRCHNGEPDDLSRLHTNGLWMTADPARMPATPTGRFLYWAGLPLTAEAFNSYRSAYTAHDLRRDSDDICLRLAGSQDMLSPFRSNTVVIPGEELRRAALALPPS